MNKTYTRYAARTGCIIDQVSIPDTVIDYDLYATLLFDGIVDGGTHYMHQNVPVARPRQLTYCDKEKIKADGMDVATIAALPVPATVRISGPVNVGQFDVSGGDLQFAADVPGQYLVQVEAFPCLPWECIIDAD